MAEIYADSCCRATFSSASHGRGFQSPKCKQINLSSHSKYFVVSQTSKDASYAPCRGTASAAMRGFSRHAHRQPIPRSRVATRSAGCPRGAFPSSNTTLTAQGHSGTACERPNPAQTPIPHLSNFPHPPQPHTQKPRGILRSNISAPALTLYYRFPEPPYHLFTPNTTRSPLPPHFHHSLPPLRTPRIHTIPRFPDTKNCLHM